MANVTTYLNKILSAVYGKDVRQSIYDSINAINTQVEGYVSAEKSRVTAEAVSYTHLTLPTSLQV